MQNNTNIKHASMITLTIHWGQPSGCGWWPVAVALGLAVVVAGDWWLVAGGCGYGDGVAVAVAVATCLRLALSSLSSTVHSSLRALSLPPSLSLSPSLALSLLLTLPIYGFSVPIAANRGVGLVPHRRTSNKSPTTKRNIPNIICIHFSLLMPPHPFVLIRPRCIDNQAPRQAMCVYDCAHWWCTYQKGPWAIRTV
jgi:hypothetical protein